MCSCESSPTRSTHRCTAARGGYRSMAGGRISLALRDLLSVPAAGGCTVRMAWGPPGSARRKQTSEEERDAASSLDARAATGAHYAVRHIKYRSEGQLENR